MIVLHEAGRELILLELPRHWWNCYHFEIFGDIPAEIVTEAEANHVGGNLMLDIRRGMDASVSFQLPQRVALMQGIVRQVSEWEEFDILADVPAEIGGGQEIRVTPSVDSAKSVQQIITFAPLGRTSMSLAMSQPKYGESSPGSYRSAALPMKWTPPKPSSMTYPPMSGETSILRTMSQPK
jgi:hypothetical protein